MSNEQRVGAPQTGVVLGAPPAEITAVAVGDG
jgi:hypothetical protein